MTTNNISTSVLKDVVAYVDVWSASKTENYSDPFIHQLRDMGAQVAKTLNKHVTHVVFKHGHQSTWNKAKKMGVKIVSVHWVARCKENAEHADEDLYPALNDDSKLNQLKKRTHRCMQPRDIPVSTPKRLKRKLDKMMEGLVRTPPLVSDTSPFIIDEESGIVYSPSSRRADTMAQRLREMRAQRENLSPTASQMQDSEHEESMRPSLGGTPTDLCMQLEEDNRQSSSKLPEDRHYSSSSSNEKKKECQDESSSITTSNEHVKKTRRNSVVTFNPSDEVKESLPNSKKPRRSSSAIKKQASLDSYIHKTSPKRSPSHPLPKQKEGTAEKLRSSSCNSKKSKSSSPLTSIKSRTRQIPQCLEETKAHSDLADAEKLTSVDMLFPKHNNLDKTNVVKPLKSVQKVFSKRKQAAEGRFDPLSDDDNVFEDFFTSANTAPRRKVALVDSTSEPVPMPSFDLEPPKRNRRKSHPHETSTKNKKHQVPKNQDLSDTLDPPKVAEKVPPVSDIRDWASGPSYVSKIFKEPDVPRLEEVKEEPSKKRQRRRTIQSFITSAESKESKSTSDGLTDRGSEMCSKQEALKTDKFMKKNRTLVMTSMPTEKQQTVLQVVHSLGGFTVVDTVCESTTHVVSGSPRRTLNILLGIARGCWILSYEWILWCLEHRQWVPEEPYELSDHFPAAPICRLQQHLSAGEHQQNLFRDRPPIFVSPLSQPPCHSLVELVRLCGGTVCRSIRQAGLCIGDYKGKKPEGTKCLSEQWILDCVTHYILLPYDDYILE